MANKDTRYIKTMLNYIDDIDGLINGRNINEILYQYGADLGAILMKMMQISEIVSHMSYGLIDDYSAIVDWQKLKELKNIIAHQYDELDIDSIADIISNTFPELKQHLTFILLIEQSKDR